MTRLIITNNKKHKSNIGRHIMADKFSNEQELGYNVEENLMDAESNGFGVVYVHTDKVAGVATSLEGVIALYQVDLQLFK